MITNLIHQRSLKRWSRVARVADDVPLASLRHQATQARELRNHLDDVIFNAENRLALPAIGSNSFVKPKTADWAWRPALWRGPLPQVGLVAVDSQTALGSEAAIFHDCRISKLTVRQLRNTREADLAPFGLRMDVFRFDGSFLSIALDLPRDAVTGLLRKHLIRMNTIVETKKAA